MKNETVITDPVSAFDIRLISLDFDGTILVYDDPAGVFHPEVIAALNALEARGIRWCANSGRDFHDQLGVLERSRQAGLVHMPDALICSESLVFMKSGNGYIPLEPWNTYAHDMLRDCHREVQDRLSGHFDYIESTYAPLSSLVGEYFTAFLVADHHDQPRKLFRELKCLTHGIGNIMITRNGGWVTVMHVSLGKGNALKEFMRHQGLSTSHVLAIGDHMNDLTMLTREVAGAIGCPANAVDEVKDAIRGEGGIIADEEAALGTLQIIRQCLGAC